MDFLQSMEARRSHYDLSNKSTISDEKIVSIIVSATKHTPSAFNSQSQMTVVLFGDNHTKLWNIVLETLRKVVPADSFAGTESKINSFKAAYGSVLYFNNDSITKSLQDKFPLYADKFPVWAEQSSGMLQFAIWNLLEAEGLGASLQHYNPLIDDAVKSEFNIAKDWRLIAQMPFGTPNSKPGKKEFMPIENRVIILGAKDCGCEDETVCSADFSKGCI